MVLRLDIGLLTVHCALCNSNLLLMLMMDDSMYVLVVVLRRAVVLLTAQCTLRNLNPPFGADDYREYVLVVWCYGKTWFCSPLTALSATPTSLLILMMDDSLYVLVARCYDEI